MPKIILKTLFFISCIALSSVQLLAQDSPPPSAPLPPQTVIGQLKDQENLLKTQIKTIQTLAGPGMTADMYYKVTPTNPYFFTLDVQYNTDNTISTNSTYDSDNMNVLLSTTTSTYLPTSKNNTPSSNVTTTYAPNGDVLSTSTSTYSTDGTIQEAVYTDSKTNTTTTLNYSNGKLSGITQQDSSGNTWTYGPKNNLIQVTSPQGTWIPNSKGILTLQKPTSNTSSPLPLEGSQDSSSKSIDYSGKSGSTL